MPERLSARASRNQTCGSTEAAEPIDCRIFEFFTKFLLWIEVLDREGSRSCFVKIVMHL